MARNRSKAQSRQSGGRPSGAPDGRADVTRLKRELAEAQALLRQLQAAPGGAQSLSMAQRMARLEEERQVARGQAVDAALARGKVEAELKALRAAIEGAPGITGWLMRRARAKVEK